MFKCLFFQKILPHDLIGAGAGRYSLSFDGTDDYVDAGNDPSLDITKAITVEAWIKPNDIISSQFIITKMGILPSEAFRLSLFNNSVKFFIRRPDDIIGTASKSIHQIGVWHHIVGTFDGTTVNVYVNAIVGTPVPLTGTIKSVPQRVFISGRDTPTPSLLFNGLIDEVRIYNRALSAFEIQDRYVQGLESLYARGIITEDEFQERIVEL